MALDSTQPKPSRPHIPDYGIPNDDDGMLPWSHVVQRMQDAVNYWISTANNDGQPHATPVWGVWFEGKFYFDGSPKTRRGRDLAGNPLVSIHLEDGTAAVILEGYGPIRSCVTRCALNMFRASRSFHWRNYARRAGLARLG